MEFEGEHDDPDEEMDIPEDQDQDQPQPHPSYHHPPSNSSPAPGHKPSSSSPSSAGVRYRECQKNHAVGIGGSAIDGCGEFMAAGEEGTLDALRCAACNCHRNFHRKETADSLASALVFPPPHHHYPHYRPPGPHHQFLPYYRSGPAPTGYLQLTGGPSSQRQLALPASGEQTSSREDGDDYVSNNPGSGEGRRSRSGSGNKRFRTKFTQEQRERMLVFAERLGWRIQKQDDLAVEQFCAETGVRRHVLKVWMHNNKNTLGKKS
ncbi:hypothetical protein MLD38_034807 [Melastoma candidum]|uniref:Uncharacterized protein n=1 Tax=Melastoma candidum TaxID=119954 RepID=A0ACB9MDA5_9MYRT|nr:hypothetical protein MLD38_034807 [Melastoma candidum]